MSSRTTSVAELNEKPSREKFRVHYYDMKIETAFINIPVV